MATGTNAFCVDCGGPADGAGRFELSESMQLLEDLGKTFAGLASAGRLCPSCSGEMIWLGAALLDAKYGVAALSLEKMEEAGLTERSSWRRYRRVPGVPLDEAA